MSISYRLRQNVTVSSVNPFESDVTIVADSDERINATLAVGLNTIALVSDVSQLKVIAIEVDHTSTVVLKSTGTATQTLTLTSAAPFIWLSGSGITNPLSADFDTAVISTAVSGDITICKLEDPSV